MAFSTQHGHDFMSDPRFNEAYDYAFNATKADPAHHGPWRVHIATWAANTALRRNGDFVECGTARAFVTTAILKYTDWNLVSGDRHFYLIDTFEGIIEELQTDAERAMGAITRHGERYKTVFVSSCASSRCRKFKIVVSSGIGSRPSSRLQNARIDWISYSASSAPGSDRLYHCCRQ